MSWNLLLHNLHSARGIHPLSMDSPNKGPVMRSVDVFDDVSLQKMLAVISDAMTLMCRHCNVLPCWNYYLACYWIHWHANWYSVVWGSNASNEMASNYMTLLCFICIWDLNLWHLLVLRVMGHFCVFFATASIYYAILCVCQLDQNTSDIFSKAYTKIW